RREIARLRQAVERLNEARSRSIGKGGRGEQRTSTRAGGEKDLASAVVRRDLEHGCVELVQHDGEEKSGRRHRPRSVGTRSAAASRLAAQRENRVVDHGKRVAVQRQ